MMVLTLDQLRREFAEVLQDKAGGKGSFDAALLHVCRIAYVQGLRDGYKDGVERGQGVNDVA
jgi:hypothetical protein